LAAVLALAACGPAAEATPEANPPPVAQPTATPAEQASATPEPLPSDTPESSGGLTVEVAIQSFTFAPGELTIAAGTTVIWTNNDSAPHTVTADDGSWGSGRLSKGDTYSFTFEQPGTYPYHCNVHPLMTAAVIVTP
jgi:plastocyanin